jgi:hypothetical protein
MPLDVHASICQAAIDLLNAASLSMGLVAERTYLPILTLAELDSLKVPVVPRDWSLTRLSRRDDDCDYGVDVGVFRKIADLEPESIDPFMLLVQEIANLFRAETSIDFGDPYSETGRAHLVALAIDPIFDRTLLDEKRVFASIVSLTYRAARVR